MATGLRIALSLNLHPEYFTNRALTASRYARGFSIFIPYVWPSNQRRLQLNMLGVALCLSFERALNVLEPRQFGIVLDRLSHGRIPIAEAALYIFYRWIQSSALSPVRQMLWLPVEQ